MLIASRIHAAAAGGEVETAAEMLDLLNTSHLEINAIVLTSAIRSCWGWGAKQHQAAKYFWDLFQKFDVKPDNVAFTALVGAYITAPLEYILSAKADMARSGIRPSHVFAETYLCSVVQLDLKGRRHINFFIDALRDQPADRLQEARVALEEFEAEGVELSGLSKKLKSALQILKQEQQ